MGNHLSQAIEDAKSTRDGRVLYAHDVKIKASAAASLVEKVCKELASKLEVLQIASCRLKTVPNNINQLAALRQLSFVDNLLTDLPDREF